MSKHNKNKKKGWWKDYSYNWKVPATKLYIEAKAYEKLSYYIQLADGEISGFGKVKFIKAPTNSIWDTDKIMIEDVQIFPQRCSQGGTTLQGDDLSKFINTLIKQKQDPHDWRCWWHSHYDFGVCWSGIDEQAIRELTEADGAELISLCMNQASDIVARKDKNGGKRNEKLSVRVLARIDIARHAKCEREIKEKVSSCGYASMGKWKGNRDWDWRSDPDYKKPAFTKPLLLDYKPGNVKIITDREAMHLGLHYDPYTGTFMRISDGKILTEAEVRASGILEEKDELHASRGNCYSIKDILTQR